MHKYCFFNGQIVESAKNLLPINDISIIRGFAVFDFFRVYNGHPFEFDDHFARFNSSAKSIGLKVPFSKKEIAGAIQKLVAKNSTKNNNNFHVRMILTGGEVKNGLEPSRTNMIVLFEPFKELAPKLFKNGAKLITYEHERFLPEAKTTNYIQAVMLQKMKKRAGAIEILYTSKGQISEATTSNILMAKNGILYTPIENILHGVTKHTIIKLAERNNFKVIQKIISLKDLYGADEVFLTATNKKVLPIVQINDILIGTGENRGKVGPISRKLLQEYCLLIKNIC